MASSMQRAPLRRCSTFSMAGLLDCETLNRRGQTLSCCRPVTQQCDFRQALHCHHAKSPHLDSRLYVLCLHQFVRSLLCYPVIWDASPDPPLSLLLKRASRLLQGRLGGRGVDREQPRLTGSELLLPSLWNGMSSQLPFRQQQPSRVDASSLTSLLSRVLASSTRDVIKIGREHHTLGWQSKAFPQEH